MDKVQTHDDFNLYEVRAQQQKVKWRMPIKPWLLILIKKEKLDTRAKFELDGWNDHDPFDV